MIQHARRFNLKNAVNLRELGGFMRSDGEVTKYGQFLRSGCPALLNENEIRFLLDYGLKAVFDFRGEGELRKEKNCLSNVLGVNYFNIPVFDFKKLQAYEDSFSGDFTMQNLYEFIYSHSESFGDVFNSMAENSEGLILFNCTAGKDRTGVVAALLLMLAGVDRLDIIADYQVSSTYFQAAFMRELKLNPEMPMHFAESNPLWIIRFMELVQENHGSCEKFLQDRGVTKESIEILRNKMI